MGVIKLLLVKQYLGLVTVNNQPSLELVHVEVMVGNGKIILEVLL
jgi:hypothetical protein